MLQKLLAYTFYKIFFDFIISEEGYFLVMIYGISNPFWFVLFQVLFIQEALLINQEIVCVTITYKESKAKINIYHRMISCIILLTLLGTSNRSRKRSSIFFQQQSPAKQCKCVAAYLPAASAQTSYLEQASMKLSEEFESNYTALPPYIKVFKMFFGRALKNAISCQAILEWPGFFYRIVTSYFYVR